MTALKWRQQEENTESHLSELRGRKPSGSDELEPSLFVDTFLPSERRLRRLIGAGSAAPVTGEVEDLLGINIQKHIK